MHSIAKAAGAAALIVSLGMAIPARAVDLVNRDRVARDVVVNRSNGQSDVVTIKPGERIAGVCVSCVILVGESSVEAVGRVTAIISGGKITLGR